MLSFILGFEPVSFIKSAILGASELISSLLPARKSIELRSLLPSPRALPKNLNGASVMSAKSFFTAAQMTPPYLKSGSSKFPSTGRSMFI